MRKAVLMEVCYAQILFDTRKNIYYAELVTLGGKENNGKINRKNY
jgi:hypothetical protein